MLQQNQQVMNQGQFPQQQTSGVSTEMQMGQACSVPMSQQFEQQVDPSMQNQMAQQNQGQFQQQNMYGHSGNLGTANQPVSQQQTFTSMPYQIPTT